VSRLTIVTGASDNHGQPLINMLRSLKLSRVDAYVVAYDLGLVPEQREAVRPLCDRFEVFEFERYPDWFDIRVNAGEYAWKPAIIAGEVDRASGPVLWLDAGCLVYGDLAEVRFILQREGFFSPGSRGTIADWTHPATLAYMQAPGQILGLRNRNGAVVGFDPRQSGMREFAAEWHRLGSIRECIAPPGSSRENHRQDQAVLSVLTYQLQPRYGFRLYDSSPDILTNQDLLKPEKLEARLDELRHKVRWVRRFRAVRRGVRRLVGGGAA